MPKKYNLQDIEIQSFVTSDFLTSTLTGVNAERDTRRVESFDLNKAPSACSDGACCGGGGGTKQYCAPSPALVLCGGNPPSPPPSCPCVHPASLPPYCAVGSTICPQSLQCAVLPLTHPEI